MNNGYIRVYTATGRDYEHHVVWRQHRGDIPILGTIHHINGDKTDNRIENLELLSHGDHSALHIGERYRGKKLSAEHRAKLSEAAKRRSADPARRAELSDLGLMGAAKRWWTSDSEN